ncbi:hypothetical protein PENSPDRAFT_732194 [Peniophora sp. CONT]|nr:hypothetical protein PENSPDRAFT_732194 [Peniophora sp. CONT]
MVAITEDSSPQGHLFSASKIIEDHAFSLLLETALFTLYTALIVYLIYYVCASRKTTESLPSLVLVYTLSMFALYSLYWALDVYYLWAEYRSLLASQSESFDKPDIQKSWKAAAWILEDGLLPQYFVVLYMQYMVGLILIALGDFVSLWRAYAVWGRPRWLYITLGCVAVVEGVLYILICASSYTEYISSSVSVPNGVWALAVARIPLTFIGYASTALAQTASTTLMAYKAWFHWREVREFMNRSTSPSLTALAVVIESGVAYLLLLVFDNARTAPKSG